ncbi:MAG TPA: hypothetical protein VFZ59_16025 [Verrucomicrobiae bacterium]|nr:hypothetical protein [Verrucomicrobiae bacterium]
MKDQTRKFLGLAIVLAASVNITRADITLFQESFEGTNLVQWIGKSGSPHQGQLVADPLNPANHVLSFSGVNVSGDMFTPAPVNFSRPRQYVLSFDFLGSFNPGIENGGFIGVSAAPVGDDSIQSWIGGTFPGALTAPPSVATTLVADGQWHHYEIDITAALDELDLAQAYLMLEDWSQFGSVPGDAFFDNIKVVGVYDISPILAQVPCEGPSPGKKWKNHGQYVSTVSKVVDTYLAADIIAEAEAQQIMDLAGSSNCGKKK